MILLRRTALLPALLSAAPASAYFSQVNNAHVEFVTSSGTAVVAPQGGRGDADETVDRLQRGAPSLWSALEDALKEKTELGYAAPRIMGLFEGWVAEFGKKYSSVDEKGRRMLVWLENHVLIETHNAKQDSSFTLGHNEFSDMTHAEFRERMRLGEFSPGLVLPEGGREFKFAEFEGGTGGTGLRGTDAAVQRRGQAAADDGDETDWHAKGLMGPIRNQGTCGACWAFSAVGAIESAMGIDKYNKMTPGERTQLSNVGTGVGSDLGLVVPLSEQDLIDCDSLYEKGCEGGLMTTTFDEEEHKQGICSEADYPYIQTEGTCSRDLCTPIPGSIVKDHVDIQPRSNTALKEALKSKPVTAAMVATDPMFQFYSGGVYSNEGCGRVTKIMGTPDCNILYDDQETCLPDINHGVLVVGYGTDDSVTTDTKTFFKVKNSWGEAWGEGGYFRLASYETEDKDPVDSWGECAILTLLSYPVMEE